MRRIRWQFLILLGGLALVVALLIGRSSGPDVAAPEPVTGGSYAEALVGSLVRLNPVLDSLNSVDRDVDRLIYSGLVRFDDRGLPRPDLAESWAISADATLYTFTLREDARWHDGEPVTSDDVIYTFSKLQDSDYPGPPDLNAFWQDVNIIRLDDYTVQFQLAEPFAPFLDYLAVGLLPDHLLRGVSASDLIDHPFNLEPIGTGPFRFDDFIVEDDSIVGVSLVAFEDYFQGRPFLDRFEFRFYPSEVAAWEAYGQGEVQGLGSISQQLLPEVLASPDLNLHTARLPRVGIVFLNIKHPEKTFFSDKKVRQALLMAVNRQWLVDRALNGQGLVASGPVLPGTWAYADDLKPVPFDRQRAADLLQSAEWELPLGAAPGGAEYVRSKGEETLTFELAYPRGEPYESIARLLVESWAAIGARVELVPVDPQALLEDYLEPRAFQAVLTEIDLTRSPDPDPYPFWHDSQAETGQNYGGFTDRNISIWLERARTIPDLQRRAELYRNFQHRFQDQVPALLLYYPVYNYAIDPQIQGVVMGPLFDRSDRFATVSGWYLRARRPSAAETALPTTATP